MTKDECDEYNNLLLKTRVWPGHTFRIFYGKRNLNNKTIHIRGIIDYYYVVCRTWSKKKHMWKYSVESLYYFKELYEKKVLLHQGISKK